MTINPADIPISPINHGNELLGVGRRVVIDVLTSSPHVRQVGEILERDAVLGYPYLVLGLDSPGDTAARVVIFLGVGIMVRPAPVQHPAYADPPAHPGLG